MSDKNLWDQYVALEKERDELRAKVESVERQKPVLAWVINPHDKYLQLAWDERFHPVEGTCLYESPGASPAKIDTEPFSFIIQRLNSNPYALTKEECVTLIKELRDLYSSSQEIKP